MPILLKHQPWTVDAAQEEREYEVEWNMWQRRQPPFHDIEIGTQVILVSAGGPTTGTLTWQVEVVEVVKGRYETHDDAWRLIRRLIRPLGISKATFMRQGYTINAAPAGWLLAWAYRPVREIMQPRTSAHHIGRNGWGVADAVQISGDAAGDGQGELSDPDLRRKVELAAMHKVREWLGAEGYSSRSIRDTSATCPYDYEVGPVRAPNLRIEVKGTIGGRGPVIVTAGEVLSAREGRIRTALAIVHDIELTLRADGTWKAAGGQLWVNDHWVPTEESLQPLQYRHRPDFGR
jgi:Protein NO VEIN, C-terminal